MSEVLRVVKGASFLEPLLLTERDGSPTDLTDAALRFMAKRRIDDADVLAALVASTTDGSIIVVEATEGSIRFAVPASETNMLEASRVYTWTLEVETAQGAVARYPDDYQGGPGKLICSASAIAALP